MSNPIKKQMKQFQQKMEAVEQQCMELEQAQNTLVVLSETSPSESFVTVTPGVLAKGKLEKSGNVLVNVGSGIAHVNSIELSPGEYKTDDCDLTKENIKDLLQIYQTESSRIPCVLKNPGSITILKPYLFKTKAKYTYTQREDIVIKTRPIR